MVTRSARVWWSLAVLALVVQCVVLYLPSPPSVGGAWPGFDKGVHAAVFAAPAFALLRAGVRTPWVALALAGHAVVSEAVQSVALPGRGGDPADVGADLAGLALGVLAGSLLSRRRPRRVDSMTASTRGNAAFERDSHETP